MKIRTASLDDLELLIKFRFAYLTEENGELSSELKTTIRTQLESYFQSHLGQDLTVYLAETDENEPVSVIFYITLDKPSSLYFLNGKTAFLMNVYTREEFRGLGFASELLDDVIENARKSGVSSIDLYATEKGKPLYLKKGFFSRGKGELRLSLGK